jgi:hypothetical protein
MELPEMAQAMADPFPARSNRLQYLFLKQFHWIVKWRSAAASNEFPGLEANPFN